MAAYDKLIDLQRRIYAWTQNIGREYGREQCSPDDPFLVGSCQTWLAVAPARHGLHVEYSGGIWEEPLIWTLECLSDQQVADAVTSLRFSGPDEGANGTREWEFTRLLDTSVRFPILRSLYIKPTAPEDHNQSFIQKAGAFEEGGEIARFAAKAPYLIELIVPNAPDASFFDVSLPCLGYLHIGICANTQRFIANLAASSNLPGLTCLDFSESLELQFTWAKDRLPGMVTPFEDYRALFASPAGQTLGALYLRNTCLSLEQLEALRVMHPKLQFMVIQAAMGGYVSHFSKNVFPWRHLIVPDPGAGESA